MARRARCAEGSGRHGVPAQPVVLILAGVDDVITRNLIVVLIPLIVLVAGGLGARRAGVLGLTGAAPLLCAVGVIATIGVAVALAISASQLARGGARRSSLVAQEALLNAVLVENDRLR